MEFKKNTIRLVDDNGKVLAEYGNRQTIANRNLLLNLYNGTTPAGLSLNITVFYDSTSQTIIPSDSSTTQPTGSSIVPWNYLRTATKYTSTNFDDTSGGIRLRGSIYFPDSVSINGIEISDVGLGSSLFRKDITESVVGGKNLNIIYDIDI